MNIQQLKQLIKQSRCGTVLDKSVALDLINELEAALEAREQLLVETLHILEITNKAVRMGAVNSSVIENHSAAIQAIRNHFEGREDRMCGFDFSDRLTINDEVSTMTRRVTSITRTRTQFIVRMQSGHIHTFNFDFSEHEEGLDNYSVLGKKLLDQANSLGALTAEVRREIGRKPEEHIGHLVALLRPVRISDTLLKSGRWQHRVRRFPHKLWPWNQSASIKSIERRIQAAIQCRDFSKAQRLDNVKQALQSIKAGVAV